MKKFKYKAVNLYGKKFSGTFLAESEQDLREQLAIQNLYLVSAKTTGDRTPNAFFSVSGKVGVAEMSAFCRQFAIMLSSGTAITDALDILSGQDFSKYFCKTLSLVCADVKSGLLLSEALSKHKRIFPDILRSMVRVGEVSGSLDIVMSSVADYFEADSKLKATVKSAMAYPAVLILMAIGIVLLLVLFVIPTFMDTFSSIDVQMPEITVALYSFSRWVSSYWEFIVIAVVAVAAAWILFLRTKRGRYAWDKCKFHMPFIGKIIKYNISARFCRAFSLLVSGGMDIVDALDETALALGNAYAAKLLNKVSADVRQGKTLTAALQKYKIFPSILVQMVSVGERTGEIDIVTGKSISFFETQAQRSVSSFTNVLQPVILIFIGVAVCFLFYAVYSPMLQIINTL